MPRLSTVSKSYSWAIQVASCSEADGTLHTAVDALTRIACIPFARCESWPLDPLAWAIRRDTMGLAEHLPPRFACRLDSTSPRPTMSTIYREPCLPVSVLCPDPVAHRPAHPMRRQNSTAPMTASKVSLWPQLIVYTRRGCSRQRTPAAATTTHPTVRRIPAAPSPPAVLAAPGGPSAGSPPAAPAVLEGLWGPVRSVAAALGEGRPEAGWLLWRRVARLKMRQGDSQSLAAKLPRTQCGLACGPGCHGGHCPGRAPGDCSVSIDAATRVRTSKFEGRWECRPRPPSAPGGPGGPRRGRHPLQP
jgi:hypothetical protein